MTNLTAIVIATSDFCLLPSDKGTILSGAVEQASLHTDNVVVVSGKKSVLCYVNSLNIEDKTVKDGDVFEDGKAAFKKLMVKTVYQPDDYGECEAIQRASILVNTTNVLVVMGDAIYPHFKIDIGQGKCTNTLIDDWTLPYLQGGKQKTWDSGDEYSVKSNGKNKFDGLLRCKKVDVENLVCDQSIASFLTKQQISIKYLNRGEQIISHNVRTEENYLKYLKSLNLS